MNAGFEKEYTEKFKKSLLAIRKLKEELNSLKNKGSEDLAVVGMGCRFPGEANDVDSYWDVLKNGKNAISEIPKDRWDADKLYDPNPQVPGKMSTKKGGFMKNVDKFDNLFFGISHREAQFMDPLHRVLLEVSYEALENASFDIDALKSTKTSVYMGYGVSSEYSTKHLFSQNLNMIDPYSLTGHMFTAASGRISYLLGLEGGNVTVSTGCSSSLVSIHLACQSLWTGEADMALAGGINLLLTPELFIALSNMSALSPDGICRTFDANANGYSRGDGVGVLAIKRLSDAIRDKDHIWSVIKGTAINQDGKSNGFTAPNGRSQENVIAAALEKARLNPDQVDYVEAHGTGTKLGDPIELEALQSAYAQHRESDNPLYVGSVKTNFGHTEGAAGVAGVIKSILALHHKQLPPHLHFTGPNPLVDWDDMNLAVPQTLTSLGDREEPLRAGISSFGISGTNAHVIVQEAPEVAEESISKPLFVLPISAKTKAALLAYCQKYVDFLGKKYVEGVDLGQICATAALRRTHHQFKAAFTANDFTGLISEISAFIGKGEENIPDVEEKELDTVESLFSDMELEVLAKSTSELLKGEVEVYNKFVQLYEQGFPVNWEDVYTPDFQALPLPTYPWQWNSFWINVPDNALYSGTGSFSQEFGTEASDNSEDELAEILAISDNAQKAVKLSALVKGQISQVSGVPAKQIKGNTKFNQLGMDSMMAMRIRKALKKTLKVEFSVKALWQHDSIDALGKFFVEKLSSIEVPSEGDSTTENWFITPKPNPNATHRLFCFHDAGGNASLYYSWAEKLNSQIELVCVELPGRGSRMGELPIQDMTELVEQVSLAIREKLDKPFALFGHSLGGAVAFEVSREIKNKFGKNAKQVFISSSPNFNGYAKARICPDLPEDELVSLFPGFAKSNFDDEEFRQSLITTMRADLNLISSYHYKEGQLLGSPITAIFADNDHLLTQEEMEKWKIETSAEFKLLVRSGGHRYIDEDKVFLTEMIGKSMLEAETELW